MTSTMWTRDFWAAVAERAIKAAAWSLAATLGAGQLGILEADWPQALSVAGMAAVLSVLGSVASDAATGDGPSLVNAETLQGKVAAQDDDGELVAGPAAPGIPDGEPVDVVPESDFDPLEEC